jgi:hypothetical protein
VQEKHRRSFTGIDVRHVDTLNGGKLRLQIAVHSFAQLLPGFTWPFGSIIKDIILRVVLSLQPAYPNRLPSASNSLRGMTIKWKPARFET